MRRTKEVGAGHVGDARRIKLKFDIGLKFNKSFVLFLLFVLFANRKYSKMQVKREIQVLHFG